MINLKRWFIKRLVIKQAENIKEKIMLNGFKTYIVAFATLCYAWGGFFTGHVQSSEAVQLTSIALSAAGLRNAIK